MSLNSKRLQDAINNKNNFHFNNEVDDLDVFVFDTFEILNSAFFNDGNVEKQKHFIEGIIESLETNFVAVDTKQRELIRCSKSFPNGHSMSELPSSMRSRFAPVWPAKV